MANLGWDRAVLQLGHHSYTPTKCDSRCAPNTWHWDNLSIAPAVPFTIVSAEQRMVGEGYGDTVTFPAPAPPASHLRFVAIGSAIAVSFDGGGSWQPALARPVREGKDVNGSFLSYWTPMPAGASSVSLRGGDWYGGSWQARDFSIWSLEPPAGDPAGCTDPSCAPPEDAEPGE
jgi:hypothetical protein